jgi:hypothetical protein
MYFFIAILNNMWPIHVNLFFSKTPIYIEHMKNDG